MLGTGDQHALMDRMWKFPQTSPIRAVVALRMLIGMGKRICGNFSESFRAKINPPKYAVRCFHTAPLYKAYI